MLVVPESRGLYSGMVPALLAGRASPATATIDVLPLARLAGIEVVLERVATLLPAERLARTESGIEIRWEACSLDLGAGVRRPDGIDGAHLVAVKPLDALVQRVSEFASLASRGRVEPTVAVVGAGAAGIEIAFALRERLRAVPGAGVLLLEEASTVLPGGSAEGRRVVARELARVGVEVLAGRGRIDLRGDAICAHGTELARPSLVILATGSTPPALLARSGLALDREGYLEVDRFLRSTSHPRVSGAGDCAVLAEGPRLPRAGVHAVRQGPVLAANLRAALHDEGGLREFRAREKALALLSTADGRAIALRGRWASCGRPWWWLKNRIDTAYVAGFRRLGTGDGTATV